MTDANIPCLGAILAGGKSRRFGSDKALAMIGGKAMLDHVIAALAPQVDAMVICGRAWPGLTMLPDFPVAGIGPLGGLGAALDHAARHGYRGVLTAPVDVLPIPAGLLDLLEGDVPAVFARQYLVGYWPVTCRDALVTHIRSGGGHAFQAWMDSAAARRVAEPFAMGNVNHVEDLPPAPPT